MTMPSPWVTPAELAAHLPGSSSPWCVLDARFDLADPTAGERAFTSGHVPGAQYLHLDHDLARERTANEGRHPLPTRALAAARFAAAGVDAHQPVIVMDGGNALFAARAWWMLRELGHPAVRVLAGGFAAWVAAGLPTASGAPPAVVPGQFSPGAPAPGFGTVDADQLWSALQAGACALDARAPERYAGLSEPLDPVAGHIPGARNLPYGSLLQTDGTLLPEPQLRDKLEAALAGSPATAALLYCGSGVTACALHLAFTTANLAGAGGPRVYPGSWSEWCRTPGRPVATGSAP
jgi:thiosulfate/3-mercaptopyruvate sulfurtransferase